MKTTLRFLVVLWVACALPLGAQQMRSLEFRNQEIRDILLALGDINNVSIVPDETVEGRASYVFANMDFDQALKVFLDSFHLGYQRLNGVYYVSRVIYSTTPAGKINVSAQDVPLRTLLRVLSQRAAKTILYDNLPNEPFTLHMTDVTLEDILTVVAAKFADFSLDKQPQFYYLRYRQASPTGARVTSDPEITRTGDQYTLKVTRGRLLALLINLFSLAGREFVFLVDRDADIQNLFLKDKTFDETLAALLLQGNAGVTTEGGVSYIVEVQRRELLKRYQTTMIVNFEYISSADFQKLLPATLGSGSQFRLDEKGNKVVLSGFQDEIKPLWDFIQIIDRPSEGGLPLRIDLDYLKTDEFLPLLPPEFSSFAPQALPGKTAFLIALPDARRPALLEFVGLVDRPTTGFPVHLKFLKSDELLSKLPPSVQEGNLARTNDPSLVFFRGTPKQRIEFLRDLEQIDVPRSQIRYELMVLQLEDGAGLSAGSSLSVKSGTSGANSFTGQFGELLSIDFDVLSHFGVTFGMGLSAGLAKSQAKVLADTTLNGLSGEKISFQNTNTTRYKDTETTTTNGSTTTNSVVRELTSGLLVNLEGWISSDQMITLKIESTLSKEVTSSSTTASLPSTSEKKLSTLVRTPSGKPIIISGLKQEDTSISLEKTPFLGDIPLLGYLFQKRVESISKTEFAIYLVPILERPEAQDVSEDQRLVAYYKRLAKVL